MTQKEQQNKEESEFSTLDHPSKEIQVQNTCQRLRAYRIPGKDNYYYLKSKMSSNKPNDVEVFELPRLGRPPVVDQSKSQSERAKEYRKRKKEKKLQTKMSLNKPQLDITTLKIQSSITSEEMRKYLKRLEESANIVLKEALQKKIELQQKRGEQNKDELMQDQATEINSTIK